MTEQERIDCLDAIINEMKKILSPKYYSNDNDRKIAIDDMSHAISPLVDKLSNRTFATEECAEVKKKAFEIWQRAYKKHQVKNSKNNKKYGQLNNETRKKLIEAGFYLDYTDNESIISNVLFILFALMSTNLISITIQKLSEKLMLDKMLNEKNRNKQNIFEYIESIITKQKKIISDTPGRLAQEMYFVGVFIRELEEKGIKIGFTQGFVDSVNDTSSLRKKRKIDLPSTLPERDSQPKKPKAITHAFTLQRALPVKYLETEEDDLLDAELMDCLFPRSNSRLGR